MFARVAIAVALMAGLVAAEVAQADSKVQMPKEGSFEFDFCFVGHVTIPVATKDFTFGNFVNGANIRAAQPGAAFDRQSARCWGTYSIVGGKFEELVFCEIVDADGDKWYIRGHGNPDGTGGSGSYSAPYGTGKYEGMVLNGEWRTTFFPATADAAHGCSSNKGTYRLAH